MDSALGPVYQFDKGYSLERKLFLGLRLVATESKQKAVGGYTMHCVGTE